MNHISSKFRYREQTFNSLKEGIYNQKQTKLPKKQVIRTKSQHLEYFVRLIGWIGHGFWFTRNSTCLPFFIFVYSGHEKLGLPCRWPRDLKFRVNASSEHILTHRILKCQLLLHICMSICIKIDLTRVTLDACINSF